MVLPIIGRLSMNSFIAGGAVAAIGAAIARPVLVGTVRAGYEASDMAVEAWHKAKAEAESVKRDALSEREKGHLESEIRQLREEVNALRAQLGKKSA